MERGVSNALWVAGEQRSKGLGAAAGIVQPGLASSVAGAGTSVSRGCGRTVVCLVSAFDGAQGHAGHAAAQHDPVVLGAGVGAIGYALCHSDCTAGWGPRQRTAHSVG